MGTVTGAAGATEVTTGPARATVEAGHCQGHQRDQRTARATKATEGVARATMAATRVTTGVAEATGEMSRATTGRDWPPPGPPWLAIKET